MRILIKQSIIWCAILGGGVHSYSLLAENNEKLVDKWDNNLILQLSAPEIPEWEKTAKIRSRQQLSPGDYRSISTIEKCIDIVNNEDQWDISKKVFIGTMDEVFCAVLLLGSIKCDMPEAVSCLVKNMRNSVRNVGGLPKYDDYFVTAALISIGIKPMDLIIKKIAIQGDADCDKLYFNSLFPYDSIVEILNNYLDRNSKLLDNNERNNIILFKEKLVENNYKKQNMLLQKVNEYIQNHPLYKKRYEVIESNINILKKQKNWSVFDSRDHVHKLGELRAVEAIDVLTPYLLLQSKTEPEKLDEKYFSIKKYPVAVSLAEIGIPSIRGLLKEIAKEHGEPEYIETAYKTMSAILPSVAILGFVDEAINNEQNEKAKKRLEKLYPLLPQQEEIKKRQEKQDRE